MWVTPLPLYQVVQLEHALCNMGLGFFFEGVLGFLL